MVSKYTLTYMHHARLTLLGKPDRRDGRSGGSGARSAVDL